MFVILLMLWNSHVRTVSTVPGTAFTPSFYSLWHLRGSAHVSKMSWKVKKETFSLFLIYLIWGFCASLFCVSSRWVQSQLYTPQKRGNIWNKHNQVRWVPGLRSGPLALCPASAHWIELGHLQWHSDLFPKEIELIENVSVCLTGFVLPSALTGLCQNLLQWYWGFNWTDWMGLWNSSFLSISSWQFVSFVIIFPLPNGILKALDQWFLTFLGS